MTRRASSICLRPPQHASKSTCVGGVSSPSCAQNSARSLRIDEGWHLYANPVGSEDLTAAQTTLTVDSKVKPADVKIEYPDGKEIDDKVVGKYKVYEEKATIKATVTRAAGDSGPLELTLKFQACNDKQCLLPATKKLKVPSE